MSDSNSTSSKDDRPFRVLTGTQLAVSIPTAALRNGSMEDLCATLESAIMSEYNLDPELHRDQVRASISTIRICKVLREVGYPPTGSAASTKLKDLIKDGEGLLFTQQINLDSTVNGPESTKQQEVCVYLQQLQDEDDKRSTEQEQEHGDEMNKTHLNTEEIIPGVSEEAKEKESDG